ncbi:MAG TPA: glycosyltransferase family protein [Longimicrobiales bacterium]|nr:glycosyltransferase family protein [Longimicrobiales bacterium]
MRVLFTVQGQGRGHLTQAIATWEILSGAGHELVGVAAGNHPGRDLPPFFVDAFPVPVTVLPSPGFVFRQDRGVDLGATLAHAARYVGTWADSLRALDRLIAETCPDLIINFFEPLTGLLQLVRRPGAPVLAAAHQFALLGPHWGAPAGTPVGAWWLRAFIRLVGFGSWKLALSFRPGDAPPDWRRDRVVVAPPLLRRRVLGLEPTQGDYVLVYVATHGYGELVREWHARNPTVRLFCFYDRPGAPRVERVGPNLTFHQLDAEEFLRMMAGCRSVVCTAGFESVCEAAFLGKPVLVVPLADHDEQRLNAQDAELAGLAMRHADFDLDALALLPEGSPTEWFRKWCLEGEARLLETVLRVANAV